MLILIKEGVFTAITIQGIGVLKIKGQLITCKIIYLSFVTTCIVFPPLLDILKASILRMAVTI